MFKLFSEILRHGLVCLASFFMKIAGNNVSYINSYKTDDDDVFVQYYLGNHQFEESYIDFLQSNYARFLNTKQLDQLLHDVAQAKSRDKYFDIIQDPENPELFQITNTHTGIQQTYLLSSIINNRTILEHMSAENLKTLIDSAIKLSKTDINCDTDDSQDKEPINNDPQGFRIITNNKDNKGR